MVITTDVKCKDCKNVYEISKKSIMDDFEFGKCPECESDNVCRVWGVGGVDVAIGKLGNSKNNFNTGPTYHPSTLGKYKGTKVK